MRLVRLGQQPSRVAEDLRAALASLGRGNNVIGGIALIGPRPLPTAKPVDAVVLLPRGVIIVVGVDLPDPAIRLHAPLNGQWKADGWPLISPDRALNPATGALRLASSIGRQLRETAPDSLPIGTIVAVGPYVQTVEQPPVDLAGDTRVLHPTATSLLAAIVSLASAENACSVEQARALLRVLAPDAQVDSEMLATEGFLAPDAEEDPLGGVTVPLAPPSPPKPSPHSPGQPAPARSASPSASPQASAAPSAPATPAAAPTQPAGSPAPAPSTPVSQQSPPPPASLPEPIEATIRLPKINDATPRDAERHKKESRAVRWLPVGAIGLLAVMLVTAIVLATTGDEENASQETASPPPSASPAGQAVQGFEFLPRASATDQACAAHAYGDVQASLQRSPCTSMRRGSFETTADGRPVAVSIAVVSFGDEATATAFRNTADTAGGGGMSDLATETGKWPRTPQFAGAAYTSSVTGTAVRLVLATWLDGASSASDPSLGQVARAALNVQLG